MPDQQLDIEHLKWLGKIRPRNLKSSTQLLILLSEHPQKFKKGKYASVARLLAGVSFSLWRAAFLADKEMKAGNSLAAAKSFLERVVTDNSIGYTQDKAGRNWTFEYYISDARYRLRDIADNEDLPDLVSMSSAKNNDPKVRWEHYQGLLETALKNFGRALIKS